MSRRALVNQAVFDFPFVRPLGRQLYSKRKRDQQKAQSTATLFFRNLNQLEALQEPLRFLTEQKHLRVLVAGCSLGCEAFTLGAFLTAFFPKLEWRIDAVDICADAIAFAKMGRYGREHGLFSDASPSAVIGKMMAVFEQSNGVWSIKREVRDRVYFEEGNVLSAEFARFSGYDLALAQNFMIHMDQEQSRTALAAVVAATRAGGALFLGGMDLETKPALIRAHGLRPVTWRLKEIHNDDQMRRSMWPWSYWSLEPIHYSHPELDLRYSTIFLKP